MNVLHVVGARPNFMKAAPVLRALNNRNDVKQLLVHTGQHYDVNMSDVFFKQLEMPEPNINLSVGAGSHARQTAEIMVRLEPVIIESGPDIVLVYGDVNSTVAATLVCAKLGVRLGHVEAGLRSFDRTMPEEINRLVTDQLADLLFTPSEDADSNLTREGIAASKIFRVGNVMIDSLVRFLPAARECCFPELPERFALVTLHRPSNVDDHVVLKSILESVTDLGNRLHVVFPAHPRTRARMTGFGVDTKNMLVMDPLPYIQFLSLELRATVVITDSGGIQEETTYLGIPCLTMRDNTERPVTLTMGTNVLVGRDPEKLSAELNSILSGNRKAATVPPLWDGQASERIADVLLHNCPN